MRPSSVTVTLAFEMAPINHTIAMLQHQLNLVEKSLWERRWYDLTGEVWP